MGFPFQENCLTGAFISPINCTISKIHDSVCCLLTNSLMKILILNFEGRFYSQVTATSVSATICSATKDFECSYKLE